MSSIIEHGIEEIRLDRAELRKPRVLDDGTKIYEARLAIADQPLKYEWGIEIPTREALSDPTYLEALRGISVVVQHPPSLRIDGQAPKAGDGRRIGSNLSARFDDLAGEVVVELAIPDRADQALVEENLKEVSEGYRPVLVKGNDGVSRQVRRMPNHIAVTQRGRASGAQIRVDAMGVSMNLEEAMARIEEMAAEIAGLKQNLIEAAGRGESLQAGLESANGEKSLLQAIVDAVVKELGGEQIDSASKVPYLMQRRIDSEGKLIADLRLRADSLEVKLPEEASTAQAIRRSLAISLGGDENRCDSVDYCDGVICAASNTKSIGKSVPVRTETKKLPV